MKPFVMQPLEKKLNRQNIISRIEKIERSTGEQPSARVNSLQELAGAAFGGATNGYTDPNGWQIIAGDANNIRNLITYIDDDDNAVVGYLGAWHGTAGAPGEGGDFGIFGVAQASGYYGKAFLAAASDTDVIGAYLTQLSIDSRGNLIADLTGGTNTGVGQQGFVIKSQTSSTTDGQTMLYLDAYSSGTPAAGFGSAVAFRGENSTDTITTLGYIDVRYDDATAGSEDASLHVGLIKAGALTTALTVDPTAGVTAPFGITVSAGGIDNTNGHFRSLSQSINDDAAISFTPTKPNGICKVGVNNSNDYAEFFYNTATPATTSQFAGSNAAFTTGTLSGTTGTDTKITFSCHTDGKIYIENRRGAARTVYIELV